MTKIYSFARKGHLNPPVAILLIISLLAMLTGFNLWIQNARAVALTSVSDTLSSSNLSASSAHTVKFTIITAVAAGETIKVQLDPTGDLFSINSTVTSTDIIFDGATLVANSVNCSGAASEVYFTLDAVAPDENLTFTVCTGDTIAAGAKRIVTATSTIANPAASASYVVRVDGTMTDSGDMRVAILQNTTVTAAVDTSLTFEVQGLGTVTTTLVNGETLTVGVTTTATSIPFGTLAVGTPKVAAQQLKLATNARNGFIVTVRQDGSLRSQTGATIDNFSNGASTVVPIAWVVPTNTLNDEETYGHIGITSEDATLTAGDEFGSQLFAGNIHVPREVFMHTGPADGTTANQGLTRVGYKVEIAALQEAATDYTMTLTYVATPTF